MIVVKRPLVLASMLALCACQDAERPPPLGDYDGSIPPPSPSPSTPICGFDVASIAFDLPAIVNLPSGALTQTSGQAPCATGSGQFSFFLADMNADGQPDLVVDSACANPSVGTTSWLVYTNTGSRFDPASTFGLPSLPTTPAGCAALALIDVDGDIKPDLVVTSLCTDPSVGTSSWLVYHNGPGGFDTTAQRFQLPSGAAAGTFATLQAAAANCAAGQPAYGFFDLTGDLKPDLVVTSACDDTTVGTSSWRVYPGTGTGLSTPPVAFALPTTPAPTLGAFASPGAAMSCATGVASPAYEVLDFNADAKPDILVLESCTDATVGSSRWLLYPNGGSSFASSPIGIPLPAINGEPSGAFNALSSSVACASGNLAHSTVDVDADGRPDILVNLACSDATVGASRWLVFHNDGMGGFAAAESYSLPALLGGSSASPVDLDGPLACTGASQAGHVATYLVRGPLDLVVTATCTDATVGATRWLVFQPTVCSGT